MVVMAKAAPGAARKARRRTAIRGVLTGQQCRWSRSRFEPSSLE